MPMLDIQLGSHVYGTNGTELGVVTEVWPYTETHGYISRKNHELPDSGPIHGTGDLMISDSGYFEVTQPTSLGLASRIWYVPFPDVESVVPGESVTVSVDAELGEERYGSRPEVLNQAV